MSRRGRHSLRITLDISISSKFEFSRVSSSLRATKPGAIARADAKHPFLPYDGQLSHHTLLGRGCRQSTKYGSCGVALDSSSAPRYALRLSGQILGARFMVR